MFNLDVHINDISPVAHFRLWCTCYKKTKSLPRVVGSYLTLVYGLHCVLFFGGIGR